MFNGRDRTLSSYMGQLDSTAVWPRHGDAHQSHALGVRRVGVAAAAVAAAAAGRLEGVARCSGTQVHLQATFETGSSRDSPKGCNQSLAGYGSSAVFKLYSPTTARSIPRGGP
jgi:hypothetical protein